MLITVEETYSNQGTRYEITYCKLGHKRFVRIAYNALEKDLLLTIDPFKRIRRQAI